MPTIEDLHKKHSMYIVREQLRKIVEIYAPEWIIIHELVQNGMDAIQDNPNVTQGQVDAILDIDNDEVTVTDNGTGFVDNLNLLCLGGTGTEKRLSSRSPSKGYQGVGLKAVMYSTVRFKIESQTSEKYWTFISENLESYLDPESSVVPGYLMEVKDLAPSDGATYTTINAKFPPGKLREFICTVLERFLNTDTVKWYDLYKQEASQRGMPPTDKYLEHFLEWYFRTQSYVGCLNRLLNVSVKNVRTGNYEEVKPIEIRLKLKSTSKFINLEGTIGSWLQALNSTEFRTTIPNRSWDYAEIASKNQERAQKWRITPNIVTVKPNDPQWETFAPTFRDKFLDLKLLPKENETEFRKRYADIIALLERPHARVKAEDYQDVLEQITGVYLAVGRTSAFETLGITNRGLRIIAANGIPTDHELSVITTSSTWYLETIHLIINLDATLNLGKRHLVNTRLVGRIEKFFEACYPKLASISKLFVGTDSGGTPETDILPDVVQLGKLRRQGIPFRRFPDDEDTLIGLYSVLITMQSYAVPIYQYFRSARYDGKFSWQDEEPAADSELKLLEFKIALDDLVNEFETAFNAKDFEQLSLIVVWDRRVNVAGWQVKGVSQARQNELEQRGVPTDLIEYVLEDRYGHYRPLICVADMLQNVPKVEGEDDDLDSFVKELG